MSDSIKLACLQMNSTANVEQNLDFIEVQLKIAQQSGVELIQLPENFAQMPAHPKQQYMEKSGCGLVQEFLSEKANQYQIQIIAGSIPIQNNESDKPFARCLVFDNSGQEIAHYDKIHLYDVDLPNGEKYRESETYLIGSLNEENISPIKTPLASLGLSICYDLRFPELYRDLVLKGAEILCVPSAFTYSTGQAHWQTLLKSRAIENQAFVMAAAQVGTHANDRTTWGHSMIINPWGEVLAQFNDETGLLITEVDLANIAKLRTEFPVLNHRRLSI